MSPTLPRVHSHPALPVSRNPWAYMAPGSKLTTELTPPPSNFSDCALSPAPGGEWSASPANVCQISARAGAVPHAPHRRCTARRYPRRRSGHSAQVGGPRLRVEPQQRHHHVLGLSGRDEEDLSDLALICATRDRECGSRLSTSYTSEARFRRPRSGPRTRGVWAAGRAAAHSGEREDSFLRRQTQKRKNSELLPE